MNIWLEIFGYIGSALVVVSLLMASVVKLRIINTIGSVISGTYALIIGSFPLALMNISLIIINVYYLIKLLKNKDKHNKSDCLHGTFDQYQKRADNTGNDSAVDRDQCAENHDHRNDQSVWKTEDQHAGKT